MPKNCPPRFASRRVPDSNAHVATAARNCLSVRRKCNCRNLSRVADESAFFGLRAQVPKAQSFIVATRDERKPIRADRQAGDFSNVAPKNVQFTLFAGTPDSHRCVAASRYKEAFVR